MADQGYSMAKVIGIDPGLDGAVAVMVEGKVVEVHDIPSFEITNSYTGKRKRKVDVLGLFRILAAHPDTEFVLLEQVWAMPKQGVSSAFTFGKTAGAIEAVVAMSTLPMHTVAPQVWKRELRVTNDKDGARSRASDLFPEGYEWFSRKKDHNRAEAALIAHYGRMKYGVDGLKSEPMERKDD